MKKNETAFSTVMLVDDNEIDNFINQKVLEGCSFARRVYVHTTGKSALEFLQNIERNEDFPRELRPQVVFLDINMPIMDGFQFVEEFEKLSSDTRDGVKIMMLTSSINPLDQERSSHVTSITGFMNKPLTREHLEQFRLSIQSPS